MSPVKQPKLKIAIAAGELSGDQLAAPIIQALKAQFPDCEIVGITGPHMKAAGCRQIIDVQHLSVMGLTEILTSIPRILVCRQRFLRYLTRYQPDIFIGIDAPDFNLPIAQKLCSQNVFTVQYNSPKVWAWRRYRIKKIQRAIRLMLTQFPFEAEFYQSYAVNAKFVGHPFADMIQATPRPIDPIRPKIGLALGSRQSEMNRHTDLFLQTAAWLRQAIPGCQFKVPLANEKCHTHFLRRYQASNLDLPMEVSVGNFREVIEQTDCVLAAAGTATLEIMLLQKPMVVTYQLSPLTYAIAKRLVHVPYIALPNLLANEALVPELIQGDATPAKLGQAILNWLNQPDKIAELQKHFVSLQEQLKGNAAMQTVHFITHYFLNRDRGDDDCGS